MNLKKKICAFALAGAVALSALSLGFASWQTTITGTGSVNASGKWDVAITGASLSVSDGASVSKEVTVYNLVRTEMKEDRDIYGSVTWYKTGGTPATPSDQPMSKYLDYYMVDTTKFGDLVTNEAIASITAEQEAAIIADDSTYSVLEALPYQYWSSTPETIVNTLLADCTNALKAKYPDTYQNYMLVRLASVPSKSFTIGTMQATQMTIQPTGDELAVWTDTDATFANVSFGLPGAWAKYTITVANQGTVNANLSNAVIELTTESDQLVLDKPDLSDEVLQPGESCTITFVVKVPDTVTGDLDAAGTLTVSLPYGQATVEEAPAAGHTHG